MLLLVILSTGLLGLIVTFLILYLCDKHSTKIDIPFKRTGTCQNPGCVRCSQDQLLDKNELLNRLQDHLQTLAPRDRAVTEHVKSLMTSTIIDSIDNQQEIQSNTRKVSGFHGNDDTVEPVMIWLMPGLTRQPFWTSKDHPVLREVATMLLSKNTVESLHNEYLEIDSIKGVWSHNRTPKGDWKVATLVNQGVFNDTICNHCPVAFELINKTLKQFMTGNCFSFAMYSCLTRGSVIEPHTGPCNYRIRCHIPLTTPTGFYLHVGQETVEWKNGELIMFDDSLIHSVTSTRTGTTEASTGTEGIFNDDDCRVVFIVDIWHPEVDEDMKKALNSVFTPRR